MSVSAKTDLRRVLRTLRKAFVSERNSNVFPVDEVTLRRLHDVIRDGQIVAGYLPLGSEADIRDVMTSLRARTTLAVPWLEAREAPMLFRAWTPDVGTNTAPGGFQQPSSSEEVLAPDVILLPLVGFDRQGNRLGQGAGHYDRALQLLPDALRIGAAWSGQEVAAVPADPWDVPLDAIMTEVEWIVPAHSRLKRA